MMKISKAMLTGGCCVAAVVAWGEEGAKESTPTAPDVVVIATRTEMAAADVPASVEVLDRAAIERSGAKTVDEAFRNLVGVDLQGGGVPGTQVRLNMRGLTEGFQSNRVLVLVDGRRVNDPYQGNVEFALMPVNNVERIEVLRGPASALYGSNAMGGVINIVTRRGDKGPFTDINAAAGNFNTTLSRVSHGGKVGEAGDYAVSVNQMATDGYMNNSDGTDRDWKATDLNANMGWRQPDDNAELRVFAGFTRAEGTDENSERDIRKDYQAIHGTVRWDEALEADLAARAYRTGDRQEYGWKYGATGLYRQQALGFDVQQSLLLTDHHRLTGGAEVREDSVDIAEWSGPLDKKSLLTSGFAQDEWRLADPLRLTVGVRYDRESDYGGQWSPRAGLLWKAAANAEFYASCSQAYRAPSLSDRYVNVEYNGFPFLGNPDLKPETLTAYEAGFRAMPLEGLRVEVATFLNDMEDSFDFLLAPDGVFRNENVENSRVAGVEAGVKYRLTERVDLFANYTWTDGEYDKFESQPDVEGNRIAYLAKDKAAAGVEYAFPSGTSHAVSGRYVGSRYGDAQNSEANRMDDYITVDWHSRWAVEKGVALTLDILNLFDKTYREWPTYDAPGLFAMGGVEMSF